MGSADGGINLNLIIPALPPPPGVTSNFENPESIAYRLFIVAIFFPVLAFAFLALRLFSAAFILKKWHLDDVWISIGFIIALSNSIVCMVQTHYGLGKHGWDVPLVDFQKFMKIGMIGGAFTYNLATLFIKISILSFYLRFSVDRAFRYTVYLVMLVTVGYTVPNAILFLYVCRPMQGYWDFSIPSECVNMNAAFHTANTLNMVTDFAILLLPIWMLKPLRAPLLKKIGVTLILMAGGFVCAVSLMRMITALVGIAEMDLTWHYVSNLIWCIVEMNTGILCACLPCLNPFVKRYFPNLFLFKPEFEQRVEQSSLRLSNRVVQFARRSTITTNTRLDTVDTAMVTVQGQSAAAAAYENENGNGTGIGNTNTGLTTVLRSKPSRSSDSESESDKMEKEMAAGPSAASRSGGACSVDPEKGAV